MALRMEFSPFTGSSPQKIRRYFLLFRFPAHALNFAHHPQRIFTENLANIALRISLLQQRFGDFRNHRGVFHPVRHIGAVEIGPEPDVVRTDELTA